MLKKLPFYYTNRYLLYYIRHSIIVVDICIVKVQMYCQHWILDVRVKKRNYLVDGCDACAILCVHYEKQYQNQAGKPDREAGCFGRFRK